MYFIFRSDTYLTEDNSEAEDTLVEKPRRGGLPKGGKGGKKAPPKKK